MKVELTVILGAFLAGCVTASEPSYETLVAHRGESVDAPENTLPAYRTAVARGFGFECDIYLSKDGRCFTFHDRDLTRTTAGANTNRCADVTWDEVAKLDVGGWGKWKGSAFEGTRPALLEEVLDLARPGRKIYVEIKTGPEIVPHVKKVFAASPKASPETVLFISFNAETCKALKCELPEYSVYFLLGSYRTQNVPWTADEVVAKLASLGVDGIDIRFNPEIHDAAFVKAVHEAGYSFHVWTVDSPDQMEKAFAAGVDTLTTNCAKKLLEAHEQATR